jgi:hypothetical protein
MTALLSCPSVLLTDMNASQQFSIGFYETAKLYTRHVKVHLSNQQIHHSVCFIGAARNFCEGAPSEGNGRQPFFFFLLLSLKMN